MTGNQKQLKTRMVHVRLPEDLHKLLRIRAAENDTTIQDWLANLIQNELGYQEQSQPEKPL